MRSDLQRILREREIGALLVPLHELQHPAFRWISRGAQVTRGYAIARPDRDPILLSYPMEREEAAATGLETRPVHDFGHGEIFKTAANAAEGYGVFFDRVFRELGIEGQIAFAGQVPVHLYLDIVDRLEEKGWKVYRAKGEDLIQLARKRKDAWELEQIASVGRRTEEVVDEVRRILRTVEVRDGIAHRGGERLMLGELKQLVTSEISKRGMVEDHETIFSQGRDAGIPHSRGNPDEPVRAGTSIVLDIFPADRATGYFFDLTRTFCVGEAPAELKKIHADVFEAFTAAGETMRAGTKASDYQALVCDIFEAKGYATLRSNPQTLEGYVHSLGHGVGLEIHEKPFFALNASNRDEVEVGDVLTIEPGLYFPERGMGVRIEDTLYVAEDGTVKTFCRSDRSLEP
jgi:Xaa-Pro aminopeptidase